MGLFDYQYGNYTGGGWTGGKVVASGERGDFDVEPINPTDELARAHDWSYANADEVRKAGDMDSYNAIIKAADKVLVDGVIASHKVLDAMANPAGNQNQEWRVTADIWGLNVIKLKKYTSVISLFFLLLVIGGLLGACHPCSVVQCGNWIDAVAFMGNDGEVYIDVPERKKYKLTTLHSISVNVIKDKRLGDIYWSIFKSAKSRHKKPGEGDDFPLKYGEAEPGMVVERSPIKIQNGLYGIRGFVFVYDGNEIHPTNVTGEFIYENGVVRNIN